jgi:predicted ATPase
MYTSSDTKLEGQEGHFQIEIKGCRMIDRSQHTYLTTELNPDLLATPFRVQTRWHVITGAPCSGKTTLLDMLADKGYQTVTEVARDYFENELAKGRTIDEIRQDDAAVQYGILDLQLELEHGLRRDEVAFLDRALPDCITFHRVFGLNINDVLSVCFQYQYASVSILDRLPFLRSKTLGPEDEKTASFVDEWLARDYSALGYDVLRVPVLPPEERLAFILERLIERGLR